MIIRQKNQFAYIIIIITCLIANISTIPASNFSNTQQDALRPQSSNEGFIKEILSEDPPNIPFPFPDARNNRGVDFPEWLKSYIVARIILQLNSRFPKHIPIKEIRKIAPQHFLDYGLAAEDDEILELIKGLINRGLIDYNLEALKDEDAEISLSVSPRTLAVWADDFLYIQDDIKTQLEKGDDNLIQVLNAYSDITNKWPKYPVEAQYPVLRAIAMMEAEEQRRITERIIDYYDNRKRPALVDSILLMLDFDIAKKDWCQTQTPELIDRTIYHIAAEISQLAGGLGRVMLYHGTLMHALGADIEFIEPDYPKYRDKDGIIHRFDEPGSLGIKDLPAKFIYIKKWDKVLNTIVRGRKVNFTVTEVINQFGVRGYRIRDLDNYYVNLLYEYETMDSPVSNEGFTEFFTKASSELIRHLEVKKKNEKGALYKPPLVNPNDGQVLPLNAWRVIFYGQKDKILSYGTTPQEIEAVYDIFGHEMTAGTTHTYKNRVKIYDFEKGKRFLREAGIPDEWLWLFLCAEYDKHGNRRLIWDFTSAGLRSTDRPNAVSAIHAYEMNERDPAIELAAITDGDNRIYSSEFFRDILKEMNVEDIEHPTPEDIKEAKRRAKIKIGLNPDQLVVSCSVRIVPEKAGRRRAFTDDNIEEMVKSGKQVVIYGNVQPYWDSQHIAEELTALEQRLSQLGYKGKFIFKPKFDIDEQRRLLAATDIQIQDSDRATGAAEYTEADCSACAGLQMGPPFWEGIIQRQGVVINRKLKIGNTIIPKDTNPESYLDAINLADEKFKTGELSIYQAQSVRLSRIPQASITAAAYLRHWNEGLMQKVNVKPVPRVCGELEQQNISDVNIIRNESGDAELSVVIDPLVYNIIKNNGAKENIPHHLIKLSVVNNYGVTIPLKLKRVREDGKLEFTTAIPVKLSRLFADAQIEATSGIWKVSRPIKIDVPAKTKPEETILPQYEILHMMNAAA